MVVILASLAAGALGGLGTYKTATRLAGGAERDPYAYWVLGLVGVLPAWLVAFVGLLPTLPTGRIPVLSAAAWIVSAAAGLVGVIATEKAIRDTSRVAGVAGARRCWSLGAAALVPAWAVAALGHVLG